VHAPPPSMHYIYFFYTCWSKNISCYRPFAWNFENPWIFYKFSMSLIYSQLTHSTEPEFVKLLMSPGINSQPGGIESLESIPGLLKRLQIRALDVVLQGNCKGVFPDRDFCPGSSQRKERYTGLFQIFKFLRCSSNVIEQVNVFFG
jgi:hypothetical protein